MLLQKRPLGGRADTLQLNFAIQILVLSLFDEGDA